MRQPRHGAARTTSAATMAIVARARSGARLRAMPQTACATTATATTFSPCSQPAVRVANACTPIANSDQRNRRGQREAEPGRQPAGSPARRIPIAMPTWLLAGPGQHLAQRHQVGVRRLVHPLPRLDVLLPEIAQVRHRPAKASSVPAASPTASTSTVCARRR